MKYFKTFNDNLWIKARLNKDNLWNFSFFSITVILCGFAEMLTTWASSSMAFPITILTVVIILVMVANTNTIALVSDGNIVSKDIYRSKISGKTFKTDSLWSGFTILFWATWLFIWTGISLRTKMPSNLVSTFSISWFLFAFTLHCILKNLPITIYFKKDNWKYNSLSGETQYDAMYKRHGGYNPHESHKMHRGYNGPESISSTSNLISNPANSWYPGNIHHKK